MVDNLEHATPQNQNKERDPQKPKTELLPKKSRHVIINNVVFWQV